MLNVNIILDFRFAYFVLITWSHVLCESCIWLNYPDSRFTVLKALVIKYLKSLTTCNLSPNNSCQNLYELYTYIVYTLLSDDLD